MSTATNAGPPTRDETSPCSGSGNRGCLLIHRARFFNATRHRPSAAKLDAQVTKPGTMPGAADEAPISALFAKDGVIVAVGSTGEVVAAAADALGVDVSTNGVESLTAAAAASPSSSSSPLRVIDGADRMLVTPGLVDAHVHLLDAGRRASGQFLDMRHVKSKEEFRDVVRAAVEEAAVSHPGDWILGGDWDDLLMGEEPDRTWIEDLAPDVPVLLTRFDVHTAVVNVKAFELAGVDPAKGEAIVGGVLERFPDDHPTHPGELSGICREQGLARIKKAFPKAVTGPNMQRALNAAAKELHQYGITGVHTMTSLDYANTAEIEYLESLALAGKLPLRVACAVRYNELDWAAAHVKKQTTAAGNWVRVLGVKVFLDGSLGSRTACFLEPFEDHGAMGVAMGTNDELARILRDVDAVGLMLMAHAIGDAAAQRLLRTYEEYLFEAGGPADGDNGGKTTTCRAHQGPMRLRVEHCQHIDDADIARIKRIFDQSEGKARVVASMQPTHADTDCDCVMSAIGPERTKRAYRFRSLRDEGAAVLAFGSDWMVMPPRPMETIIATTKPPAPFASSEAIAASDVLQAFTTGSAYAAGWSDKFGCLAPGYMADITVLHRDVTDPSLVPVSAAERLVAHTIVDGRVVYSDDADGCASASVAQQ